MKKVLIILLYFILNFTNAHTLIKVDITRGNLDPLPIAISPLHVDGSSENSDLFDKQILEILSWDLKESKCDHSFNFFTSFYGFPRENLDQNDIAKRINEENNFESNFEFGTNYYPKTFLQTFSESLSDNIIQVAHKQAYIDQLHRKISELNNYIEILNKEKNVIGNPFKRILIKFLKVLNNIISNKK